MNRQVLDTALDKLGLQVPEAEREDIAKAVQLIEAMAASVRKPRSVKAESAHVVLFPENKHGS